MTQKVIQFAHQRAKWRHSAKRWRRIWLSSGSKNSSTLYSPDNQLEGQLLSVESIMLTASGNNRVVPGIVLWHGHRMTVTGVASPHTVGTRPTSGRC